MLKKILNIAGKIITVLAFIYIARIFKDVDLNLFRYSAGQIALFFAVMPLFYALLVALLSNSWKRILTMFTDEPVSNKLVFCVYAKANIAKYLPSNVMHFVSRQILGKVLHLKQRDIFYSSALETVLLTFTVVFYIMLIWLTIKSELLKEYLNGYIIIAVNTGVVITLIVVKKFFLNFTFKRFILVFTNYSIVFFGFSLLLSLIYNISIDLPLDVNNLAFIFKVFLVSWFIGYITPGAPGGIGVRETIIILMLSGVVDKESALVGALIFRLISIIGEVIAYFYAAYLKKRSLPMLRAMDEESG